MIWQGLLCIALLWPLTVGLVITGSGVRPDMRAFLPRLCYYGFCAVAALWISALIFRPDIRFFPAAGEAAFAIPVFSALLLLTCARADCSVREMLLAVAVILGGQALFFLPDPLWMVAGVAVGQLLVAWDAGRVPGRAGEGLGDIGRIAAGTGLFVAGLASGQPALSGMLTAAGLMMLAGIVSPPVSSGVAGSAVFSAACIVRILPVCISLRLIQAGTVGAVVLVLYGLILLVRVAVAPRLRSMRYGYGIPADLFPALAAIFAGVGQPEASFAMLAGYCAGEAEQPEAIRLRAVCLCGGFLILVMHAGALPLWLIALLAAVVALLPGAFFPEEAEP
ncbi:hypothetical protein LOC54_09360 [Acetobacter sp. AN02]|uniref:hypothetical protein n=1 Tax=Acetobacter sp. AN02 TaxID=2894186 RepID=UPI00243418FB|nr:hypothetical protein [Acetobacter sp. AN02]MDG6095307.1 hypothetical protein [Acetobacter sp. AN02]